MKKTVAILQSNYIPWKGYFDMINSCDEFIIYDEAQYTKNDWRNRNQIKTRNGPLWLTLPIKTTGKFGQKISDAQVDSNDWRKKHWTTIQHSYSRTAYFNHYRSELEALYLSGDERSLSKINYSFILFFCAKLGIKTRLSWSMDYAYSPESDVEKTPEQIEEEKTARLVRLCEMLEATDYLTGPTAKNYLNEAAFNRKNINVQYMDYSNYPEYEQLYPPFVHAVSVLDLLFTVGPEAPKYMSSFLEKGNFK